MILLGCLILSIFVMKDVNHLKRAPLPATFHSSSLPLHGKMIDKSQTEKINTLEKNARVMQATIADLKREVADLDGPHLHRLSVDEIGFIAPSGVSEGFVRR